MKRDGERDEARQGETGSGEQGGTARRKRIEMETEGLKTLVDI